MKISDNWEGYKCNFTKNVKNEHMVHRFRAFGNNKIQLVIVLRLKSKQDGSTAFMMNNYVKFPKYPLSLLRK